MRITTAFFLRQAHDANVKRDQRAANLQGQLAWSDAERKKLYSLGSQYKRERDKLRKRVDALEAELSAAQEEVDRVGAWAAAFRRAGRGTVTYFMEHLSELHVARGEEPCSAAEIEIVLDNLFALSEKIYIETLNEKGWDTSGYVSRAKNSMLTPDMLSK